MGDAPRGDLTENVLMGSGELAIGGASAVLVEFVCMAKHKPNPLNIEGYTLATYCALPGYCARGADQNHEWVRVPPTPLDEITIGKMEDRPPEPTRPRDRLPERA
jgi:hypothetical protein